MALEIARRLVGGVWRTGPVEEANGGGGGGISEITSDDESLTVTDPTGPTVDLSAAGGGSQPRQLVYLKSTDDVFTIGGLGDNGVDFALGDVQGRIAAAGVAGFGVPFAISAVGEEFYFDPNTDWLMPFYVPAAFAFDALGCVLNTGEDGKTIRLALYEGDQYGQPTDLVVATDPIPIDVALGSKEMVSDTVTRTECPAGVYVAAVNSNATAITAYPDAPCFPGWWWNLAGTPSTWGRAAVARAYAAFPSTYPGGWAAADVQDGGSSDGTQHPLMFHFVP